MAWASTWVPSTTGRSSSPALWPDLPMKRSGPSGSTSKRSSRRPRGPVPCCGGRPGGHLSLTWSCRSARVGPPGSAGNGNVILAPVARPIGGLWLTPPDPRRTPSADPSRGWTGSCARRCRSWPKPGAPISTVLEVVERSKTSLRSFYQHFTTKDELLLALIGHDHDRVDQKNSGAKPPTTRRSGGDAVAARPHLHAGRTTKGQHQPRLTFNDHLCRDPAAGVRPVLSPRCIG